MCISGFAAWLYNGLESRMCPSHSHVERFGIAIRHTAQSFVQHSLVEGAKLAHRGVCGSASVSGSRASLQLLWGLLCAAVPPRLFLDFGLRHLSGESTYFGEMAFQFEEFLARETDFL